jgi:hypothetical protein
MRIHDGEGNGPQVGITNKFRMKVEASTRSAQARASIEDGTAFQVIAGDVDIAASEQNVLVIKNNDKTDKIVVTYIRLFSIGAAADNVDAYFTIALGGGYTSGGTALVPKNVNTASGVKALNIDCYDGTVAVVLSGTQDKIDKTFKMNDMNTYNKEGAVVIAPGGMLTVKHKGSTAAGVASARVSFYLTDNGGT